MRHHLVVLLLLGYLDAGSALSQEVYRWTDDRGRIHYSDQAPEEAPVERIDMPRPPSTAEAAAAAERGRRIKETGDRLETARAAREAAERARQQTLGREREQREEIERLRRELDEARSRQTWFYTPWRYPWPPHRPPYHPPHRPPIHHPERPGAHPQPGLKPPPRGR